MPTNRKIIDERNFLWSPDGLAKRIKIEGPGKLSGLVLDKVSQLYKDEDVSSYVNPDNNVLLVSRIVAYFSIGIKEVAMHKRVGGLLPELSTVFGRIVSKLEFLKSSLKVSGIIVGLKSAGPEWNSYVSLSVNIKT